ncbi:MAG: motility protein A [Elusimicrobia bacterium CG06_land_8_20_14_3_00_38_11]|nr:MAG: motility protein A [Elusimicrobia bacterium CG06_land_8_20_14_3_00_38_11]
MDVMTILGILTGFGAILFVMACGHMIYMLFNVEALVLIFGGTFGAAMITYPWRIIKRLPVALKIVFFPPKRITKENLIKRIIQLSQVAKRDGVESLQKEIPTIETPFLADGLQMIVDGLEADIVKEKLEKEISSIRRRHQQLAGVFRSMGTYAPIFGLLGTLVGVVQVLKNLTDPTSLGASMAIAMTASFYGIFSANFIFLPIAGKLGAHSDEEISLKEIITKGVLSIQKGDVPVVLEKKLEAFVAYRTRQKEK